MTACDWLEKSYSLLPKLCCVDISSFVLTNFNCFAMKLKFFLYDTLNVIRIYSESSDLFVLIPIYLYPTANPYPFLTYTQAVDNKIYCR